LVFLWFEPAISAAGGVKKFPEEVGGVRLCMAGFSGADAGIYADEGGG